MTTDHFSAQYKLTIHREAIQQPDFVFFNVDNNDGHLSLPEFLKEVARELEGFSAEQYEHLPITLEAVPTWWMPSKEAEDYVDQRLTCGDWNCFSQNDLLHLVRAIRNDRRPEMAPLRELVGLWFTADSDFSHYLMEEGSENDRQGRVDRHDKLLDLVAVRATIGPYSTGPEDQRTVRYKLNEQLADLSESLRNRPDGKVMGGRGAVLVVDPLDWLILGEAGLKEHLQQAERFLMLPPFVQVESADEVPEGKVGYKMFRPKAGLNRYHTITERGEGRKREFVDGLFSQRQQRRTFGQLPVDLELEIKDGEVEETGAGLADLLYRGLLSDPSFHGTGQLMVKLLYPAHTNLNLLGSAFEAAKALLKIPADVPLFLYNDQVVHTNFDVVFVAAPVNGAANACDQVLSRKPRRLY